jgi:hypothetical protein
LERSAGDQSYEWHKLVPELDANGVQVLINGVPNMIDKHTATEKDELQLTDRIVVSTYVQGNGPETDVYTDKPTAYEIRMALRDRFENINTMGQTELTGRFYDVVKNKSQECPDAWLVICYT